MQRVCRITPGAAPLEEGESKEEMKRSSSFEKSIKGAAGVHLVVAELSMRGYVAMPTTRNLKSVDIVAFNEEMNRFAFIQVKTTEKPKSGWPVHTIRKEDGWDQDARNALVRGEHFFYVFVLLPETAGEGHPAYYVVPPAQVADEIVCSMKEWLGSKPGRKAERQLCAWAYGERAPLKEQHRDKWERLNLGPGQP